MTTRERTNNEQQNTKQSIENQRSNNTNPTKIWRWTQVLRNGKLQIWQYVMVEERTGMFLRHTAHMKYVVMEMVLVLQIRPITAL